MKLVRNATISLEADDEAWRSWSMQIGKVTVETIPIGAAPDAPSGRRRILVRATVELDSLPEIDGDGLVLTPNEPRKRCESAIELAADVVATYVAAPRSISSAVPWIAYVPESAAEREFLQKTSGIDFRMNARQNVRESIDLAKVPVDALSDRLTGVGLFADAISQTNPLAAYRELVRFFELAFGLAATGLSKKLTQFLNTGVAAYARGEVEGWFALRHAAMHGDGKSADRLVVQADVRPLISRMIQAARDVLFNKSSWHSADRIRRDAWRPIACVADADGAIHIQQHCTPTMGAQLLDAFDAYPVDLTAILNPPPQEWWCPLKELKSRQTTISILGADGFGARNIEPSSAWNSDASEGIGE